MTRLIFFHKLNPVRALKHLINLLIKARKGATATSVAAAATTTTTTAAATTAAASLSDG